LQSGQNPNKSSSTVWLGYTISVIGLIGIIFMYTTISHDYRYTYSPPFTDHELGNIILLVGSIILLAIGIGVIIKQKN
jgi:hypothetical protein